MKPTEMVPGQKYIRTGPCIIQTIYGSEQDRSMMRSPVVFDGLNSDGTMIVHNAEDSFDGKLLGTLPKTLWPVFNDGKWRPVKDDEKFD